MAFWSIKKCIKLSLFPSYGNVNFSKRILSNPCLLASTHWPGGAGMSGVPVLLEKMHGLPDFK